MDKLPRNEQIKLAAQMRASVIALFNNLPLDEELEPALIAEHIKSRDEGLEFNDNQLSSVLNSLVNSTQIRKVKHGRTNKFAKSGTAGSGVVKPMTKAVPTAVPGITLDIVKSTGRVRLSFQGLVIEIGVIEK